MISIGIKSFLMISIYSAIALCNQYLDTKLDWDKLINAQSKKTKQGKFNQF